MAPQASPGIGGSVAPSSEVAGDGAPWASPRRVAGSAAEGSSSLSVSFSSDETAWRERGHQMTSHGHTRETPPVVPTTLFSFSRCSSCEPLSLHGYTPVALPARSPSPPRGLSCLKEEWGGARHHGRGARIAGDTAMAPGGRVIPRDRACPGFSYVPCKGTMLDGGSSFSSFPNNDPLGTHVCAALWLQTRRLPVFFYGLAALIRSHGKPTLLLGGLVSPRRDSGERQTWRDAGPDCSERVGGFERLCSPGLSAFPESVAGSSCFTLNSRGESRQGAGCATCERAGLILFL